MKILTLLIVVLSVSFAEEPKLPPSVQSILNKAESTVSKNRTAYDAANDKAFIDAEKALKAELDKLTKAGKLDDAVATKSALETFRIDLVVKIDTAAAESAKKSTNLLGDETILKDLVPGLWDLHRDVKANDSPVWASRFLADGTAVITNGGTVKWSMSGDQLTVTFNDGSIHKWTMSDKQVIVGFADGAAASMRKVDYKKRK